MIESLKKIFKSNKKYIEDDVFSVCDEIYSSKYNCSILKIEENNREYKIKFLNYELYNDLYDYYDEIYQALLDIIDIEYNLNVPLHEMENIDYTLDDVRYSLKVQLQGYLIELDYYKYIGIDNIVEVDESEENI